MLETNRVCVESFGTFHVFHYLLHGSPENLREKFGLNPHVNFVSSSLRFEHDILFPSRIYKTFFLLFHIEQRLVGQTKNIDTHNMTLAFHKVDRILTNLRLDEKKKMMIYEFLASILHLCNVEFISVGSKAEVSESSRVHIFSAAQLLKINAEDLEHSLLFHSIEVHNSVIM